MVVDSRLHEAGRDMDHKAKAGEATSALKPPTEIVGQSDAFVGDAEYCLTGQEYEVIFDFNHLGNGLEVRFFSHVVDVLHGLENAELVSQVKVYRSGANLLLVEWLYFDIALPDPLQDLVVCQNRHFTPPVTRIASAGNTCAAYLPVLARKLGWGRSPVATRYASCT